MKSKLCVVFFLITILLHAQTSSISSRSSFGLFDTAKDHAFSKDDKIEDDNKALLFVGADNVNNFYSHDAGDLYSIGFYVPGGFTFGSFTRGGFIPHDTESFETIQTPGTPIVVPAGTFNWTENETSKSEIETGLGEYVYIDQGIYFQGDVAWGLEFHHERIVDPLFGEGIESKEYKTEITYYADYETYVNPDAEPDIQAAYERKIESRIFDKYEDGGISLPVNFTIFDIKNELTLSYYFPYYGVGSSIKEYIYLLSAPYPFPVNTKLQHGDLTNSYGIQFYKPSIENIMRFEGFIQNDVRNEAELSIGFNVEIASHYQDIRDTRYEYEIISSNQYKSNRIRFSEVSIKNMSVYTLAFDLLYGEKIYHSFFDGLDIAFFPSVKLQNNYDFDYQSDWKKFTPKSEYFHNYIDSDSDGYADDSGEEITRHYVSNGETQRLLIAPVFDCPVSVKLEQNDFPLGFIASVRPGVHMNLIFDKEMPVEYTENSRTYELGTGATLSSDSIEVKTGSVKESSSTEFDVSLSYAAALFWKISKTSALYFSVDGDIHNPPQTLDIELEIGF